MWLTRLSFWSCGVAFGMKGLPECTDPAWVQFGVKRRVQQDSGDRQGGRQKWFDVTRRPPTWHVDLAANTGVTPLNRPKNIDLSLLLHLLSLSSSPFLPLSISLYLPLSLFSSLSQPPSVSLAPSSSSSLSLSLSISPSPSLSPPTPSAKAELVL